MTRRGHGASARGGARRARRLRRVRHGAQPRTCSRSPTGVDDGTALALLVQGTTAWHLYRTAGRVAAGESVVVHSAAGGRGLAGGAARARRSGAGRVIATASSRRSGARWRSSWAPTRRSIPRRRVSPSGWSRPTAGQGGGRGVRHGRRRGVRRLLRGARAVRADRRVRDRQPGAEPGLDAARCCATRGRWSGFYLFHCLERPGMFDGGAARTCSSAWRAASCGRSWAGRIR